ncbi:MAG: hypothetical protein PHG91_11250 [Syntrophales bacterium]|nr:hypothetical protein [Syntrophales bacterium]MDD5233958.1 hypothetical protein [Syntrophales bacterium]MDD5532622.1 hypothetical protein [Syntrophales bacterium]
MNPIIIMTCGLFILAVASGMLGLGVAFAAVPFLALFLPDLINQVQPLSFLLNGITALFASLYVPSGRIRQMFGVLIVIMTLYKIYTLIG